MTALAPPSHRLTKTTITKPRDRTPRRYTQEHHVQRNPVVTQDVQLSVLRIQIDNKAAFLDLGLDAAIGLIKPLDELCFQITSRL